MMMELNHYDAEYGELGKRLENKHEVVEHKAVSHQGVDAMEVAVVWVH
jgi:hypothetical protein